MPVKNEVDNNETLKKVDTKSSSEKKIHKASKEDICSEKQNITSVEVCTPFFSCLLERRKPIWGGLECKYLCNNCTCVFHTFERG